MSTLTEEEIRRLGCSEWARYMDSCGYGRPSYLGNRRQRAMAARKIVKQRRGDDQLQAAGKPTAKDAA